MTDHNCIFLFQVRVFLQQFGDLDFLLKKEERKHKNFEMASQKVEIKMARFENSPWGFRVHGGTDFGAPLTIQKVRQVLSNIFV